MAGTTYIHVFHAPIAFAPNQASSNNKQWHQSQITSNGIKQAQAMTSSNGIKLK
jgi:hypothetical protein